MIKGNIEGIRKTYLNMLDELLEKEYDKNLIIDKNVLDTICMISGKVNREISIYINRKGRILLITIGDNKSVSLEDFNEKKDENSLSGIKCIHTHPNGSSMLSDLDITALISLKFDLIAAVSIKNDTPVSISLAYLCVENGHLSSKISLEGPFPVNDIENINYLDKIHCIENKIYTPSYETNTNIQERVILVGGSSLDLYSPQESLDELRELVETAGGKVVEKILQNKNKIDPAYYIGSGKAKEISLIAQSLNANTVVFDDELNGAQVRNLEEVIGCKVIDRTFLILDIFAQRAKSSEGKIQVELAQLKYRLPRLIGIGNGLSRTGGGIGTRGPGEKKLETDRRHIKDRIYDLESELNSIKKNRLVQNERRKSNEIPIVALAGYTNAGKSTLRNKLCEMNGVCKENVFVADMLFATLDTTTRSIILPSGKNILFSDTVGFIRKLPHELINAFKSTLEEVIYSDLIIHVVDSSNKNAIAQIETVNSVLDEIGAGGKNTIIVLNKVDKSCEDNLMLLRSKFKNTIEISALNNYNLDVLINEIDKELYNSLISAKLMVPFTEGSIISYLHDNNCIEHEEYTEFGITVEIKSTPDIIGKVKKYLI